MMLAAAAPSVGWGSVLDRLTNELDRLGLGYATLRETCTEVTFLVAAEDVSTFEEEARRGGLQRMGSSGERSTTWLAPAEAGEGERRVTVVSELTYGEKTSWLSTGEPEQRILRRGRRDNGRRVAAEPDQLVDALLHNIVDLGGFSTEERCRVSALVQGLRGDPMAAGRAAERIQQELAPALTWSGVLADVLHGRWDELASHRRALCLHMLARSPRRSLRSWISAKLSGSGQHAPEPVDRAGTARLSAIGERPATASTTDPLGRKQIRGSSLLLSGRGLATGFKLAAELLVVRYLTTAEYGSWTYALSAVVFLKGLAALGLHRAVARFVPLHIERGERDQFVALLAFVLGALTTSGLGIALIFHAFPNAVASLVGAAPDQRLDVLFIVVLLVPVETIDDLLTNLCAAFSNSRTIFVRRYLLSPSLRLAVACVLVLLNADVRFLAYGYLISGLVGVAYYAWTIYGVARKRGLLDSPLRAGLQLPVRRVLSYTVPIMGADLCAILMVTTAPLLLGYFGGVSEVALFQVVVPAVALNNVVGQTFAILFEPAFARLQVSGDRAELSALYWRSATWVAVLSFPAFAICLGAAEPLTALLFGERYVAAAPILSLLAIGTYVDVSLGFNSAALRVLGKVRWLLAVTVLGAAFNLALNLAMIPRLGALGAAIATCTALIAGVLMKQAALRAATGVRLFDPHYARAYLAIALATVLLAVLHYVVAIDAPLLVLASVLAAVAVPLSARRLLSMSQTFPELARVPGLGRLFG